MGLPEYTLVFNGPLLGGIAPWPTYWVLQYLCTAVYPNRTVDFFVDFDSFPSHAPHTWRPYLHWVHNSHKYARDLRETEYLDTTQNAHFQLGKAVFEANWWNCFNPENKVYSGNKHVAVESVRAYLNQA